MKMEFLDANIFIYAFYENEYTEKCQEAIKNGGITNTLILAETFNTLDRITNKEKAHKAVKSLLKSNLHITNLDINTIFEALKRINKHKLSIYDMIHYASALLNNCESILSYDKDFDNLEIPRREP